MMRTHLALDGSWEACNAPTACKSPVHTALSIEEAQALPEAFIEQLAEAFDPPTRVDPEGTRSWLNAHGYLHRGYGLPAVINVRGGRAWYRAGLLHRDGDKPAMIDIAGGRAWYQNDMLHREHDLPALMKSTGELEWRLEHKLHREHGPARIYPDGGKEWWTDNVLVHSINADGTTVVPY